MVPVVEHLLLTQSPGDGVEVDGIHVFEPFETLAQMLIEQAHHRGDVEIAALVAQRNGNRRDRHDKVGYCREQTMLSIVFEAGFQHGIECRRRVADNRLVLPRIKKIFEAHDRVGEQMPEWLLQNLDGVRLHRLWRPRREVSNIIEEHVINWHAGCHGTETLGEFLAQTRTDEQDAGVFGFRHPKA